MQVLTDPFKSLKTFIRAGDPDEIKGAGGGVPRASIISVCSQKGGVGKTTTAVNMAFLFAERNRKKVLLIDLDPQGHVETSLTSIIPDGQRYRPLSNLMNDRKPNIKESLVRTTHDGFSITPGDKSLIETESLLSTKIGKEFFLREALHEAACEYDAIFIDCPPNLGNLTLNALVASQYCIVPCELSTLSLEGVSDIFQTIDTINERLNKKLLVLGIVLTRVDARNLTINQAVLEQLNEHARGYLFDAQISVNTDLAKAQLAGQPVSLFAPSSKGARNYLALCDEMMKRLHEFQSQAQGIAASPSA